MARRTARLGAWAFAAAAGAAQEPPGSGAPPPSIYPPSPPGRPPPVEIADAAAASAEEMKPYRELIPGCDVGFDLVPIAGGSFVMGSPETEAGRGDDEGPAHAVEVSPFWIGRHEVTWDEYHPFMQKLDLAVRARGAAAAAQDAWADAVSRPTPPYVPMDFGYGIHGHPALCMTQFAARHYTKWLSMKTGRRYRLPTEAEWEYACRAGTSTAYSFGEDPEALGEHAWHFGNSDGRPQPVGRKKPNPWGLFDMHGNVAEWVLDQHDSKFYAAGAAVAARDPVNWPTREYPHGVRGGSWDDDPERLRSAARRGSAKGWKVQDPQLPKSIWYFTDAKFVGFRVVRPLREPTPEELARWWEPDVASIAEILERQRTGGR